MTKLADYWTKHFPNAAPVGWDLRSSLPDRWVRFHSLPGSKRYPENAKDRAIVEERAELLFRAVLGQNGPWYLYAYVYEPDPALPFEVAEHWTYHGVPLTKAFTCPEDADPDASTIIVFGGEMKRFDAHFGEAVLGIAEDKSARAAWVSPTARTVFAPYDGGFDLITATPQQASELRRTHKKWLSKRADGL